MDNSLHIDNNKKINIIGKGIAGLTCAIALEKAGFNNISIFDQLNNVEDSAKGAGIILACNAMQIFKKLGIYDELLEKGHVINKMNITDENLNVITSNNMDYFSEMFNVKTIAIHREVLFKILNEKVESQSFLSKKLLKIVHEISSTQLVFDDNSIVESDIVIGADGLNSNVRKSCFGKVEFIDSGQYCWRGIAYTDDVRFNSALNEIWGKSKRFGFVRIDKKRVYWYALVNEPVIKKQISIPALREIYKDFHKSVLELINSTIESEIIGRNIKDFKTPRNWFYNNICLIGDAAHAMTPNLGQGACQAIEDAYVLANCMKKYKEIPTIFSAYQYSRLEKAIWVVERSRKIGEISQINNNFTIFFRNNFMKLIPQQFAISSTKKLLTVDL